MDIETWLALSIVLNLALIAWILGSWHGRKLAKPIEDLTARMREDAARLEERVKWLDWHEAVYGEPLGLPCPDPDCGLEAGHEGEHQDK